MVKDKATGLFNSEYIPNANGLGADDEGLVQPSNLVSSDYVIAPRKEEAIKKSKTSLENSASSPPTKEDNSAKLKLDDIAINMNGTNSKIKPDNNLIQNRTENTNSKNISAEEQKNPDKKKPDFIKSDFQTANLPKVLDESTSANNIPNSSSMPALKTKSNMNQS